MAKRTALVKIDPDFREMCRQIDDDCMKNPIINEKLGVREITRGMVRMPSIKKVKEELIKFHEYRNAFAFDVLVWIVGSFVGLLIIVLLAFFFHNIYTIFSTIPNVPGLNVNVSLAAQRSIGQFDTSLLSLRWLGILVIFCEAISMFVANAMQKSRPVAFIIYIVSTIISVVVAIALSNAWEADVIGSPLLGSYVSGWTAYNYFMHYLPHLTVVIGLFGGVILALNILTPGDTGGLG
jgi:hypothetical protein